MSTHAQKAQRFWDLHQRQEILVVPNPINVGTARLLAHLGAEALATSSAGFAHAIGKPDAAKAVTREEAMEHTREIADATDLPVNADLENGFGDEPADVALTIEQAAAAGAAGCSIEDATSKVGDPIYPIGAAVERVAAGVAAARSLSQPFVLTARSENFLYGRADLEDTISRLQAFADAGADVLYAPGLPDMEAIRAVVGAVDKPVNVLAWPGFSVAELAEAGVKRITLGSWLSRAAMGAFVHSARRLLDDGVFDFGEGAAPFADLNEIFGGWPKPAG